MSEQPIVSVRDIHKSFGAVEVLKGVSFDVPKGDVVCIIGPSGSGKSTVLRCINGLIPIDSGSIRVASFEVEKLRSDRETISSAATDCVRVMVRALDQAGHKLPFLFEPVAIDVTGAGRLVGPKLVPLRGGATGFWIKSTGARGPITVAVSSPRFATTTVTLHAE